MTHSIARAPVLSALIVLAGLAACSSSSPSGTDTTPVPATVATCPETFAALCERACACGGATNCVLIASNDAGIVSGSEAYASATQCENFYATQCGTVSGIYANFDYNACESAAKAAACVPNVTGGQGAALPSVCVTNIGDAG